jgi:hypothetical protein
MRAARLSWKDTSRRQERWCKLATGIQEKQGRKNPRSTIKLQGDQAMVSVIATSRLSKKCQLAKKPVANKDTSEETGGCNPLIVSSLVLVLVLDQKLTQEPGRTLLS